jgi:hypothetical protein
MLDARRAEYEAALRQAGWAHSASGLAPGNAGRHCRRRLREGDDPEAGIAQFESSDEPLNTWFREQMKEVHAVDISQASFAQRRCTTYNSEGAGSGALTRASDL